jgi:hypothetical protein
MIAMSMAGNIYMFEAFLQYFNMNGIPHFQMSTLDNQVCVKYVVFYFIKGEMDRMAEVRM